MGFFGPQGFVTKAIKKIKSQQQDTSNPGHTHGGDSSGGKPENQNEISILPPPPSSEVLPGGRPELGKNFMDANMNNFASLIDPSSVDQGGRTVLPGGRPETGDPILNVPTPPAPELGQVPVPIPGVDETGVQSLY